MDMSGMVMMYFFQYFLEAKEEGKREENHKRMEDEQVENMSHLPSA